MNRTNKKAAIEMSMTTFVTIVLVVIVMVLGIFFIQRIFQSAKGVVDLTDQQVRNEIQKLFSEEKKVVILPSTQLVEIKQESRDGVGIGIKNLLEGVTGTQVFSYEVIVGDASRCGGADVEDWIEVGKSEANIPLAVGEFTSTKVLFRIPTGSPLCTVRYRVNVKMNGNTYATSFFDIVVKAK